MFLFRAMKYYLDEPLALKAGISDDTLREHSIADKKSFGVISEFWSAGSSPGWEGRVGRTKRKRGEAMTMTPTLAAIVASSRRGTKGIAVALARWVL